MYTRQHAAAIRPYVAGDGVRGCVCAWLRAGGGGEGRGRRAVDGGGGEEGSARNACAAINTRSGGGEGEGGVGGGWRVVRTRRRGFRPVTGRVAQDNSRENRRNERDNEGGEGGGLD